MSSHTDEEIAAAIVTVVKDVKAGDSMRNADQLAHAIAEGVVGELNKPAIHPDLWFAVLQPGGGRAVYRAELLSEHQLVAGELLIPAETVMGMTKRVAGTIHTHYSKGVMLGDMALEIAEYRKNGPEESCEDNER